MGQRTLLKFFPSRTLRVVISTAILTLSTICGLRTCFTLTQILPHVLAVRSVQEISVSYKTLSSPVFSITPIHIHDPPHIFVLRIQGAAVLSLLQQLCQHFSILITSFAHVVDKIKTSLYDLKLSILSVVIVSFLRISKYASSLSPRTQDIKKSERRLHLVKYCNILQLTFWF